MFQMTTGQKRVNLGECLDHVHIWTFCVSAIFSFFLGPAPSAVFMGHEQCIKAYKHCFLVWTVIINYFFIIFSFQFSAK